MPFHPTFHIVSLILSSSYLHAQTVPPCFFPNGTSAEDFFSCDLTAEVSFCCRIDSACLGNKVCKGSNDVKNGTSLWLRGACTDITFTSPDCPQFCKNFNPGYDSWVVLCDKESDDAQTACCYDWQNKHILDPLGCCSNSSADIFTISGDPRSENNRIPSGAATMTRNLLGTSSAATSATSAAFMPSRTAEPVREAGMSIGVKVGIAIGSIAIAGLASSVALLLWRRNREPFATASTTDQGQPITPCEPKERSVPDNITELPKEMEAIESEMLCHGIQLPYLDMPKEMNASESAISEVDSKREAAELVGSQPVELEGDK